MKNRPLCALALASVAAIAVAQEKPSDEYPLHTPEEVIALASEHPGGVKVAMEFPVAKATFGKKGNGAGHVFLDSMEDYRDPHSVNVNVFPHSAQRLKLTPNTALVGKTIKVQGVAKRVRIACHGGCPQDSSANHYFQTQIFVREGDDAQVDEMRGE